MYYITIIFTADTNNRPSPIYITKFTPELTIVFSNTKYKYTYSKRTIPQDIHNFYLTLSFLLYLRFQYLT